MTARKKVPYPGRPKRGKRYSYLPVSLQDIFRDMPKRSVKFVIGKYAYWLNDEQIVDPALLAVAQADRDGRQDPVLAFIQSDLPFSAWGREVVANYFRRKNSKRRGPKPTPIYDLTSTEIHLELADAAFQAFIAQGMDREAAIKKAAIECNVPVNAVRELCDGKHASLRRAANRNLARPQIPLAELRAPFLRGRRK